MTTTSVTQYGVTSTTARAQRYDSLLGVFAGRIIDRAVGTGIPTGTRLVDAPQSKLWLGMLASEPKLIADAQSGYTYGSVSCHPPRASRSEWSPCRKRSPLP